MEITITQVTTWNRVLNAARMTVHKASIEKEPTIDWKRKMLFAEHSPIRLLEFDVTIKDVPYFAVMHLVRHNQGIEKFVATSREDRTGIKREERRQTDLVDCQFSLNAQAFINISRKRLCATADSTTRGIWNEVVRELRKIEPLVADMCQPDCIYRGVCPEMKSCGYTDSATYKVRLDNYRNLIGRGKNV